MKYTTICTLSIVKGLPPFVLAIQSAVVLIRNVPLRKNLDGKESHCCNATAPNILFRETAHTQQEQNDEAKFM